MSAQEQKTKLQQKSWLEQVSNCLNAIWIVETLHEKKRFGEESYQRFTAKLGKELEELMSG